MGEIKNLKQGLEFANKVETVKDTSSNKMDTPWVTILKRKLEDFEHQSKRNNIVISNIPKGTEKYSSCQVIISNILNQHVQLEGNLEIIQTRQTNIKMQSITKDTASPLPRPIPHVFTTLHR